MSHGKSVEIRKAPKVYICDTGILNLFSRIDEGRIFENIVFQNLRTKGELNYYQKKSGVEIDFILNKEIAYEVKFSAHPLYIKNLHRISFEIGIKNFNIVCKKYTELTENVIYGFML